MHLQCIYLQYVFVGQIEGVLIRKQLFLFYNFEREEEALTVKLRALCAEMSFCFTV